MKRLFILAIIFLLWGCANRIAPTGGPKDEDPPVLIRSNPEDSQRNFKSLEMELEFNEFINLKSLKEQLIITPRIDSEYDFKFKKKTVYLNFEEPFADSTTYTLNFREGIVDITENTPAQNLQIAFSTGNLLDTLEIYGTVVDMFTFQPMKDVTVGLYTIEDTLDIFTGPPYYFAKTDEAGHYHFRNIKDGSYRLYAFQDGNKNLTCQSASEAYAFLREPIALDTTLIADTLRMEYMNIDTLEMTRVRNSGRYFNLIANKYITEANLKASNDSTLYYHFNDDHDGLVIYNTFDISDSLEVYVTLKDSLKQVALDTFFLKFPESSRRPNEYKVLLDELKASKENKVITGEISYTKPLAKINLDSIHIYYDSLTQYSLAQSFTYEIDSLNNKLSFRTMLPQIVLDSLNAPREAPSTDISAKKNARAPQYQFKFSLGTFYSVEKDTSETINRDLKFTDVSKTGIITGKINTSKTLYTIQLLDQSYKVVQETKPGTKYSFKEIKPGEYYIRILIDENENGVWDHSDIRVNRMAEPIIMYKDESGNNKTAVRANWEITLDLKF